MSKQDITRRKSDNKGRILTILLGHLKNNIQKVPISDIRDQLEKQGITSQLDSIRRTVYTMEAEGLLITSRVIARGYRRKIEIAVNFTPKGLDAAYKHLGIET